jgi:hypothetical protein
MAAPRRITIDASKGASKNITFQFEDEPDLSAAVITMVVKLHSSDAEACFTKTPNINQSPNLETGEFVITLDPADTENLVSRSYVYELTIEFPETEQIYKPLFGDFKLYNSLT